MSNMSEMKIVQTGLKALVDRWPMIKTWSVLPNSVLFAIGKAVNKSNSSEYWGKLIYLPRYIDHMVDEMLGYDEDLYYTRTGKGYVYDDGLHAQYGDLDSIMTLNN
jgi:hypothetical protein